MKIARICVLAALPLVIQAAYAGDLTRDAALGGGLGGAIGAELGGRNGAVIGAGVGAVTGAAIGTSGKTNAPRVEPYFEDDHDRHGHRRHGSGFCPPGQAKKGNC